MRKPIIAGNWKMNLGPEASVELVEVLERLLDDTGDVEVVVCPPFVDIPAVSKTIVTAGGKVGLGAQNMHWEESGAYTGEISPLMLLELDVTHVIVGHSERRQLFGETDQGVNRKVISALQHELVPIMCVGETLKQRESGQTDEVVGNQVRCGLFEIDRDLVDSVVIAYEPIWAIGTGKAALPQDAQEVTAFIRKIIADDLGSDAAGAVRIQYGGSVKPDNVSLFMEMPDVDGALVGGASLKAEDFSQIVRHT